MKYQTPLKWMAIALLSITLSGCGSVRYVSTLKPSGDKTLAMGDVRFSIVNLSGSPGQVDSMAQLSTELYPNLFTDDWTGVPVAVKIDSKTDSSMGLAAFLTGFCTLGTIPIPGTDSIKYTVETSLINNRGERVPAGKVAFEFDKAMWMSVLSPLGLMPIFGISDLPRDYIFLPFTGEESFKKASHKEWHYKQACLAEAVVKTLRTVDQAKLVEDYQARRALLQEITVDGKRYWCFLAPTFSAKQDQADCFTALIYQDYPKRSTPPLEQVVVARREASGVWRPQSGYLRLARTLTSLSVLLDNNIPSKAVVRTYSEPPLTDFLDTPDLGGYARNDVLRWSNGVLLDAKNRSLDRLLREESREDLLSLVTRIERAILDLNEKSEQAKDQAQAKVEKGQGDPAPDREFSLLCRQRIEILKPILAALKQAAAGKNP